MSMPLTKMVEELFVEEGRAALVSIAESLRRIADSLERPEIGRAVFGDDNLSLVALPEGEMQATNQPEPSRPDALGREICRELITRYESGQYYGLIAREEDRMSLDVGIVISADLLCGIFPKFGEKELIELLISVPGVKSQGKVNGVRRFFVPLESVHA